MKIQKILGMPPESHVSESLRKNSMPILEITPCIPNFQAGLNLFSLKQAWEGTDGYLPLLESHGFELDSRPLKVAYIADNFPTDSFTNEYGESFLNRMTDVASQAAGEVNFMMGSKTAGQGIDTIINGMKDIYGMGTIGSGLETAKKELSSLGNSVGSRFSSLGSGGKLLNSLMGGARVDFPQVWKNSGFTPQYSVTVRLWNPMPGNYKATEKYIVGPIAALLLLCVPLTKEGHTYNWPFLHKIRCRGVFDLKSAYISNIAVIKGGDQQQIAWNQRMGIVDVRIDFGSLYSSLLAGINYDADADKPTLKAYLENLLDSQDLEDVYEIPPALKSTLLANQSTRQSPLSPKALAQAEVLANQKANKAGYIVTGPNGETEKYIGVGDRLVARNDRNSNVNGEDVTSGTADQFGNIIPSRSNPNNAAKIAQLTARGNENFYT